MIARLNSETPFEFEGHQYKVTGFVPPTVYDTPAYTVVDERGEHGQIEAIIAEGLASGKMSECEASVHQHAFANSYF